MSSKSKIIVIGIFLILLINLSIFYLILPKLEIYIKGNDNIDISLNDEYKEYGATAYLSKIFKKEKIKVKIIGDVNTRKPGKYLVTYKAKTKYLSKEKIRVVNVIDNIKPEIFLESEVLGCKKNNILEYQIKAIDNFDGDISEKIEYKVINNEIIFNVKDAANNTSELTSKINYVDNEGPKITLVGDEFVELEVGDTYKEYGAKAYDFCDGDITNEIKINHNINTLNPNKYEVEYSVIDKDGKKTTKKRYVTIYEKKEDEVEYEIVNGATIYLTFDDGPGMYTEEILNVLDKYNVKATFFVTNQFSNYKHLIKEEYQRGHSVGIHTYTHKWSVYESVESYLNDFEKIENIIYEQTGNYSKIFRFPGGSSNTISKKYQIGIISELAKLMEEKGYKYYDWTFDSGDTSKNNNSVKDIIKNFKKNLKGDGEYIVLMHDIKKNTLNALPKIIEYANSKGYKFDKITEDTSVVHLKIVN